MTADVAAVARGNFVRGEWRPAAGGATFDDRNPADVDDLIGCFPDSGAADVEAAIDVLRDGWRRWAAQSPEARAGVLDRAATLIAQRADAIAAELTREEGKTLDEARMEARRIAASFRLYAGEAMRLTGETYASEGTSQVLSLRVPVGVVAVITPWNFPLAMAARKIAPALAAGNAVLFKPSEVTPLMGQRLVEVLLEAGVPGDVLALVQGRGAGVGRAITAARSVDAITFTGSYAVGREIHAAAGTDTRLQLEMGGKNATIVLADADVGRALAIIVRGAFGLTGQACTGTSRVLVAEPLRERLEAGLCAAADAMVVGNGAHAGVSMGPLASAAQLDKVLSYLDVGRREGARVAAGGVRVSDPALARGHFVRPTVFVDVPADSRLLREEIFGPVVAVRGFRDLDEAIALANDTEYGLSTAVVTQDLSAVLRLAREVDTGIVKVNSPTTGVALNAPFGGFRHSSNQAAKEQAGANAMDFYTRIKTVYLAA